MHSIAIDNIVSHMCTCILGVHAIPRYVETGFLRVCLVACIEPNQEALFGCLVSLLGLHRTFLKAAQRLTRWKRSNRQFLASQAQASASEGALGRVEMGEMRADYVMSSSTSSKLLSNLLSLIYTTVLRFEVSSARKRCTSMLRFHSGDRFVISSTVSS